MEYFLCFLELVGRLLDICLRYFGVLEMSSDVFGRLWDTFGIMGWLLVAIWTITSFLGAFFGLFWSSDNHEKLMFYLCKTMIFKILMGSDFRGFKSESGRFDPHKSCCQGPP